jgi:decaprenylphospho-beta-D-erythro-pentofuranosid-2-ulose 2-reductase
MTRVLVIGATSAIAEATARLYAQRGARLYLVARNAGRLDAIAADLRVRGAAEVATRVLDVDDHPAQDRAIDAAWTFADGFDVVLVAHGTLPSREDCEASADAAVREFTTNGTSTIRLATLIAPRLAEGGTLAVISSVAGDRGRASNYLYGSAKAAVTTFLSGLGQRLRPRGINVLAIKPGFVDTPMTAAFRKGPLWATPAVVAAGIVAAIERRAAVAYVPRFWWGVMAIIKAIPEWLFRKLAL